MEHGQAILGCLRTPVCVSMLKQLHALFHQNFEYPTYVSASLSHNIQIFSLCINLPRDTMYLITDLSGLYNTYIIPFIFIKE